MVRQSSWTTDFAAATNLCLSNTACVSRVESHWLCTSLLSASVTFHFGIEVLIRYPFLDLSLVLLVQVWDRVELNQYVCDIRIDSRPCIGTSICKRGCDFAQAGWVSQRTIRPLVTSSQKGVKSYLESKVMTDTNHWNCIMLWAEKKKVSKY